MKFLLVLPLFGLLIAAAERRSRRLLRNMGQPVGSRSRLLADLAALAALALLLWPAPPAAPVPVSGPALALAVDVSASMAASDTLPSRLEQAKDEIRALAAGLPGARFALLPFAGAPVLQVPLTGDKEALLFFVDRLAPKAVAAPGSAPEEAALAAGRVLDGVAGERAVILFSDGERTVPEPAPLSAAGIPVYTVPLGTEDGHPLMDEKGQPLRDEAGHVLLTRSDPERLRRIAETSGGTVLAAEGSPAVTPLIERWAPKEDRPRHPGPTSPAVLAVLLLLLRHLPFRRRRWRLGAALALTLLLLPLAACEKGELHEGRELFSRAVRQQSRGHAKEAANLFARAAALLEGEDRAAALFNRGTLLFAGGNPSMALPSLEEALLLCPGDMACRLNLALALRALGDDRLAGVGDGDLPGNDDDGPAMSRSQALQLLESIRPEPDAPVAARTPLREKAPARDW